MQSEPPITQLDLLQCIQASFEATGGTFLADLIVGWLPKITSPLLRVIYANIYWKNTEKICSAWKNEKKLCKINWKIAVSMQDNTTVPSCISIEISWVSMPFSLTYDRWSPIKERKRTELSQGQFNTYILLELHFKKFYLAIKVSTCSLKP